MLLRVGDLAFYGECFELIDLYTRLEHSETFAQHENRTFMVDMLYHVLRIYVIESVIIKWEPSYLSRYAIFRLVGNRSVLSQQLQQVESCCGAIRWLARGIR